MMIFIVLIVVIKILIWYILSHSVLAHYADLLTTFSDIFIDAVLISDSFLKPFLSFQFSLPGFKLIRKIEFKKAGVALRYTLRSEIVSLSTNLYNVSAEYLLIEVTFSLTKVFIAVFYSPSFLIDYFSTLDNLLNNVRPLNDQIILLENFNTCLLKNNNIVIINYLPLLAR